MNEIPQVSFAKQVGAERHSISNWFNQFIEKGWLKQIDLPFDKDINRVKTTYSSWKNRELITSDKSSYLLFEDINKTTTTKELKKAFEQCGLRYRSWHCCRHSRGTFLYGKTGDKALSMAWLGFSSERFNSIYFHTYEALMREIISKDFDWESF